MSILDAITILNMVTILRVATILTEIKTINAYKKAKKDVNTRRGDTARRDEQKGIRSATTIQA